MTTSQHHNTAMSAAEIEKRVIDVICAKNKIPADRITPETTFAELGIDSLDAVSIMFALEEEFGIDIPGDGPLKVKNARETAQLLSQTLATSR
jgi:acyl carrier protein